MLALDYPYATVFAFAIFPMKFSQQEYKFLQTNV